MLVSRLDDKAYGNILKLIKVDSIDEFEIPGIEDFPTERSSRRKKDDKRKSSRSKPRSSDNRSKDEEKKKKPSKKPADKKLSDSKSTSKPKKSSKNKRSKEKELESVSGFGDNVPAFFNTGLK